MTPLCKLAQGYGTDKFAKHGYTPIYYDLLKDRITATKLVMEIGIKHGASLIMWANFFPDAKIIGIDRKERLLINAGRIKSFVGNQDDDASLVATANIVGGKFDLIVDDGSHLPAHQVSSLLALMPFLSQYGIYVIEDVNDDSIMLKIPAKYSFEKIRTSDKHPDSVLVIVRHV